MSEEGRGMSDRSRPKEDHVLGTPPAANINFERRGTIDNDEEEEGDKGVSINFEWLRLL